MLNTFFFIALPYMAIGIFLVGVIYRYKQSGFQVSSLSSQFLEGKTLFWGAIPFHWGILIVFLGHFIAFAFPDLTLWFNSQPQRLIGLEVTAFIFGFSAFLGLLNLFFRRITNARVQMVTNKMDIVIELLLLAQIFLGLWTAYAYRWGSSWFAADLSPYLWSILKLEPQTTAIVALPVVIKLHIIGAFVILLIFPFTRLVHFVVAPFHYINRSYQKVMWNWDRKAIRDPNTAWAEKRPKNN